ncbi:MAG: hypothetical protein FWF81_12200, partial [Defluviitaleaceae bacterium]|nr:hypothetical protein [Defluviitaleaceae bacterium]
PPIEVCLANSNHPPKRGDCDTSGAERINWCRNNAITSVKAISIGQNIKITWSDGEATAKITKTTKTTKTTETTKKG